MRVEKIQEILQLQSKQNGLQRIVFDGKWGIGKTWQIDQFCQSNQNAKNLKVVKVSLFGKQSVDEINHDLFVAINGKLKKFTKTALTVLGDLEVSVLGFGGKLPNLSFLIGNAKLSDKNFMIIFDDFERKGSDLSCKEVFGYIDELCSKNQNVKVCLVMNEEALEKKDKEEYKKYFEKTFDKCFHIDTNNNQAVESIVQNFAQKHNFTEQHANAIKVQFEQLDDCNLRILQSILCELETYLQNPKMDVLKTNFRVFCLVINYLTRVVFDCKTDEYFLPYSKNIENNKVHTDFQLEHFFELEDSLQQRISAITKECVNGDIKLKYKRQLIQSMVKKYLYLEDDIFDEILALANKRYKPENIFVPLFYCSDSEQKSTAKKQYKYFLSQTKIDESKLISYVGQWYQVFDNEYIDKNLNPQKLQNHILRTLKTESELLFDAPYFESSFGFAKQFLNDLNQKVYEERINLVKKRLHSDKSDVFVLIANLDRYHNLLSKNNIFDKRLQKVFCDKKFFLQYMENGTREDEYDALKKFCRFVKLYCDDETNKTFCQTLEKFKNNTTQKSFVIRLENLYKFYNNVKSI